MIDDIRTESKVSKRIICSSVLPPSLSLVGFQWRRKKHAAEGAERPELKDRILPVLSPPGEFRSDPRPESLKTQQRVLRDAGGPVDPSPVDSGHLPAGCPEDRRSGTGWTNNKIK